MSDSRKYYLKRLRYVINSHASLIDMFISIFRKEYCQEKQMQTVKLSVQAKLRESRKPTSSKRSAKSKGQER